MRLRALRNASWSGFLYGSLLYGGALSLVHVVHNHLGSVWDALITYAFFVLLYGLWGASFFGLASVVSGFQEKRGVVFGLFAFNLVFWEAFCLYGLTYDQAPFGPAGALGMAAVLLGLGLAIAIAVCIASWLLLYLLHGRSSGRPKRIAAAAFVVGLVAHVATPFLVGGEAEPKRAGNPPRIEPVNTGLKVILVGFDGADWRVIRPLMEKGELPAFAGLVRDGAAGDLETIHDSNSAVIWASLYTGERPERHGVLDFYRIRPLGMGSQGLFPVHRTYFKELADLVAPLGLVRQVPVDRFSLQAAPLWEIADRARLSIGVVDGYFYSFPALRPTRPESWFFSYGLDELAARPSPRVELFTQPKALFRQIRPLLEGGDFYWQSAVLLKLLQDRPQPSFVNFYTHQPDSFQHWYWKWLEPQRFLGVTDRGLVENADRIPKLHRDFDLFLSELLAAAGPQTVVIVASDHGHSATMIHGLYTQHRHGPPGILLMRGGPVKRGVTLEGADIYDVYPTALYLLGLPVPQDVSGKVLLDAIDPGFVRLHPVRTIPSLRGLGLPPGLPGASRGGTMDALEIEKLKSLGYIGF
jgi:hypothetical protein